MPITQIARIPHIAQRRHFFCHGLTAEPSDWGLQCCKLVRLQSSDVSLVALNGRTVTVNKGGVK